MFVSSVTGHGKALFQISLDNDGSQKEVVSARDVEGLTMALMLAVNEQVDDLATSRAMVKYGTLETGIAKVRLLRVFRLGQQPEVLIVQRAAMDHLIDEIPLPRHGEKADLRMVHVLQGVSLWRDHRWSEYRPQQSKTTNGEQR